MNDTEMFGTNDRNEYGEFTYIAMDFGNADAFLKLAKTIVDIQQWYDYELQPPECHRCELCLMDTQHDDNSEFLQLVFSSGEFTIVLSRPFGNGDWTFYNSDLELSENIMRCSVQI